MRIRGAICPLCEYRSIWRLNTLWLGRPTPPSWTQQRAIAQLQKRRPSRMTLSPEVSRSKPVSKPKQMAGAFGGMNRTDAGIRPDAERRRQQTARNQVRPRAGPRDRRQKGKNERTPGAMKALRMQQSLAQVSQGQRSHVKSKLDDITAFAEFPLLPSIQQAIPEDALRGMVDIKPTPIQRLAIPALLGIEGNNNRQPRETARGEEPELFLLAAETGSGKTLAYILPIIDAIKRAEAREKEAEAQEKAAKEQIPKRNPFELEPPPLSGEQNLDAGRPKVVILLPTSELVDQVGRFCRTFSHTVKLRVAVISAAYTATVIRNRLFGPGGVDIVISTPHLLSSIATTTPNVLSRVTHLVADEADSLFDRSFAPLTLGIIDRASPSLKQIVLCSATIPRSLDSFLRKRFPDIRRLTTPNLHAVPRRVQLNTVDIDKDPYGGNRDLACADTIWNIGSPSTSSMPALEEEEVAPRDIRRIIVFVNERDRAQQLAAYLKTKGIDAAALNRDTPEERHDSDILDSFTSRYPHPPSGEAQSRSQIISSDAGMNTGKGKTSNGKERVLPRTKVLVMTDLGSRGIDTIAVRHVILYDVPHTTIDFIHRLGRTGRMGRRGRGVVLVGKDDRKDVVREVREGMYRGASLL